MTVSPIWDGESAGSQPQQAPWRAEVDLAASVVGKILRAQFPDLGIRDVSYLSEGWDCFAFLADERWVFRFPKRREIAAKMLREIRLLTTMRGRIPLPVPDPVHNGQPDSDYPFHFMGYSLLEGTSADRVEISACHRNACDLGRFLTALHACPTDHLVDLGFDANPPGDHAEDLLSEACSIHDRIIPYLPPDLGVCCAPFLDGSIERPPRYDGPLVLTHGDLQAEHIILSPVGMVSGVIDFGDAAIGEPAVDFVGLWAWQGPRFVRAVMESYRGPKTAAMEKRIAFMAKCLGLIGLGWCDKNDPDRLSTMRRFLRNACVAHGLLTLVALALPMLR